MSPRKGLLMAFRHWATGLNPQKIGLSTPSTVASGVADPTQLTVANGTAPDGTAYDALNVPAMAVGDSYLDPVTSRRVWKASSSAAGYTTRGVPPYAEGGPHISLPWTGGDGDTYYSLVIAEGGGNNGSLVDFNYTHALANSGTIFSNQRDCPAYAYSICHAWSCSVSTPRILYYTTNNGIINRYDTSTSTLANTGNFPKNLSAYMGSGAGWFFVDKNDDWFCVFDSGTERLVTWRSSTNTTQDWGTIGDEPRLCRDGAHVIGMDSTAVRQGDLALGPPWETTVDAEAGAEFQCSHPATLHNGYLAYVNPYNGDDRLDVYDPATTQLVYDGATKTASGWAHGAGQWVVNNTDAWILISTWKETWPVGIGGGTRKLQRAIGFIKSTNADERLLCHAYSTAAAYDGQPHATISPDGKVVMWGSDMNGVGSRQDTFVTLTPTS